MTYEGYGPHGIAIFVETATDNTTRTVANVRSYFNKHGGSLGTSGSLEFLFDHKCVFHIAKKEDISLEDLELELIDYGVDELDEDEDEVVIYGEFAQNSAIQKYLEENGFEITSSEFVRIPNDLKEVTAEQREAIEKLIEKLEEDDDVQNVFHNMKEDGGVAKNKSVIVIDKKKRVQVIILHSLFLFYISLYVKNSSFLCRTLFQYKYIF